MTIQITIIGLGQVGASIGLALAKHKEKILRCGHDPEPTLAKKMEKEGAVDKVFFNLPESVRDADIVLLTLPAGQVEETLKFIAEDLRSGVVVIDTSPVHSGLLEVANRILRADQHFISIYPVINPVYIEELASASQTPHPDLFEKAEFLVAAQNTTHPDAIKLVEDLASLVNATAYLSDPVEADGISARIELLPQAMAAALIHTTINQPGWNDSKRCASKSFTRATAAIDTGTDGEGTGSQYILNQQGSLQVIDQLIESLRDLRGLIEEKDETELNKYMKKALVDRNHWVEQRRAGDWEKYIGEKPPSTKERIGGLFGLRERKKKTT